MDQAQQGQQWAAYHKLRERTHAQSDVASHLLYITIMSLAAANCIHVAEAWELAWQGVLIVLAVVNVLLMVWHPRLYLLVRPYATTVLRLGSAAAPLLTRNAVQMLSWTPRMRHMEPLFSMITLLIGDHILLLTFMALGMRLSPVASFLIQFGSLVLFSRQNLHACDSSFMRDRVTKGSMRQINLGLRWIMSWLYPLSNKPYISEEQVCRVLSLLMHVMMGLALPMWHVLCGECGAAVRWWQGRGLDPSNRQYRAYRFLHTTMCRHSMVVETVSIAIVTCWVWLTLFLWYAGDAAQKR